LLYDFADYYGIVDYFRKKEQAASPKTKTNEKSFRLAAKYLKNSRALEFIDWWAGKMKEIYNLELASKRIEAVHKGLQPYPVIVSPFATSTAFSPEGYARYQEYVADMGDIVTKCREGLALMESIVDEAERKFDASLE
jgi:hypothetical protein